MGYGSLHLVGESWRRLSLSAKETAGVVCKLRMQGVKVQQFQEGWAAEVDGTQIFCATSMGNERYHVRLNSAVFPDV